MKRPAIVLWLLWNAVAVVTGKRPLPVPHDQQQFPRLARSRWHTIRREWTKQKVRQSRIPPSKPGHGSMLTLDYPTPDRLSAWFWDFHHEPMRCNHGDAGMTKPVREESTTDGGPLISVEGKDFRKVVPASKSSKASKTVGGGAEDSWWPGTPGVSSDSSWRSLRFCRRVGRGNDCYERVKEKALGWEFASPTKGIVHVAPRLRTPSGRRGRSYDVLPSAEEEPAYENAWAPCGSDRVRQVFAGAGRRLATVAAVGPKLPFGFPRLRAVNPVVVVYEMPDERHAGEGTTYASTAYATAKGHWIRGEERVTVALRPTGDVDVEILSFSKPAASVMGRLCWPFLGRMQRAFFLDEMDALERAAVP